MDKFIHYSRELLKRVYFHKIELIDGEHWVTVEDCFPLTTMADFFAGYARVQQKRSWELSEKEQ
jgi:hypothetical protein